jgi:ectoine hydroxylase-related dioxygenase (phytanoyl-CoA dioxygenase family)
MLGATTAEQVDSFAEQGFVVVPGLLSHRELDDFGREVDRAVALRTSRDERSLAEKSRYEQSFIQCINLWEDAPGVRPLTFHPLVAGTAARLIGADRVRLWHDQALYKEPGGRDTDPHQDAPYWPVAEAEAVTAWIPFDGATLDTGTLGYVAGSHRLGIRKFVNIFTADPGDVLADQGLREAGIVFPEVPRGAVAFHHCLTFHLAGPNATDRARRVHTAIYFRDGCTRGKPFPHPSVDRAGIAVGEVIASEVTPVAWPRAVGDLPLPPPLPERALGPWPGANRREG